MLPKVLFGDPAGWVGTWVYRRGRTQRIGVVRKAISNRLIRVAWEDGVEETISPSSLMLFETLIADHKKKLHTHEKHLNLAKEKLG